MKKINLFLSLLAVTAVMFSCAKEETPGQNDDVTTGESADGTGKEDDTVPTSYLSAFAAGSEAMVKSTIAENGKTAWENGDVALVYVPATDVSARYVFDAADNLFKSADETALEIGENDVCFYYPADYFTAAEGAVSLNVPASVTATTDYYGYKSPMAGMLASGSLTDGTALVEFKNIGSILRVNLTSAFEKGETVTSVTLVSDNQNLSGAAAVTWDKGLPVLAELTGENAGAVTADCGDKDIELSAQAANVHFFVPSGVETNLEVKVNYAKEGWDAAPYTSITRSSALSAERSALYDIDKTAGFFSGGNGSQENPYLIATPADFKAMATAVNSTEEQYGATDAGTFFGSAGVHYQQTADIDFAEGGEKGDLSNYMIGSNDVRFSGTYIGKSDETQYSISNFSISAADVQYVGLFAYCSGATINNIRIAGASVVGKTHVGVIVGRTDASSISGCEVAADCSVEGPDGAVAGIAGSAYEATAITNCINRASSTNGEGTGNNVAGIVGYTSSANILNSHNYGTVTGDAQVGGMTGRLVAGKIAECGNSGKVAGSGYYVGGVTGYVWEGSVLKCANNAEVAGSAYVGGIVGDNFSGGFEECVNSGDIEAKNNYVGGIAGRMGYHESSTNNNEVYLKSCISTGAITGVNSVAAIVGAVFEGAVYECCGKGSVTGTKYVGALVGYIHSSKGRIVVFDSIAKSQVSGDSITGGVVGCVRGYNNSNYITVTNCVGDNVSVTASGSAPVQIGSFIGRIYEDGSMTDERYVRVRNNFTVTDTTLGFAGSKETGQLYDDYYLYGPDITTGSNPVKLSEITADLMNTSGKKFGTQMLTPSSFQLTPSSWTTVAGISYPLPSSLVALGEEYYK